MYKRRTEITNVHQAVQVLGAMTVKCLALSASVFRPDQIQKSSGIDARTYFSNVLTVAAACEKIAKSVEYRGAEEAFVAGLLHDIGTMFFMHHYPKEFRQVIDGKVPDARSIIEAEQKVFGTDHCEAGYHLALRWRLPQYICEAIRDHHSLPEKSGKGKLASIVYLGNLLAADSEVAYNPTLEQRLADINAAAKALEMDKAEVDAVSIELMSATINAAEYLGIDIGDIEEMLKKANQEIWHTYLMVENLFKERQELSQKLLQQERARGAYESKAIAMATLSHYINNAAMAVSGRSQLMRMQHDKDKTDALMKDLPKSLEIIDRSVRKIVAVLAEIAEISPIDKVEFLSMSQAMNIDDRIAKRMEEMDKTGNVGLPDHLEAVS
ncbi:HDOD domain-containing protein, partial [candidate division GN15 bacterium]|nr:HDOD domain-containing protein [candidate division GN15 bacterium]